MKTSTITLLTTILSLAICTSLTAQTDPGFKVFSVLENREITLEELVNANQDTQVLFFGEEHNDSIGHAVQAMLYQRLLEKYQAVTLSLEMFETDCQLVLDEYRLGLITEDKFEKASRPWSNYATDYEPIVKQALEADQYIIAANAPRRYVNLVSRKGLAALDELPKAARQYLPKKDIYTEDRDYEDRFWEIMQVSGHDRSDPFFHAQCTWDATMAGSIANRWKKDKETLVFHLNGRFHTDYQQGTMTQLQRLKPKLRQKNISCFPASDFAKPDWDQYKDQGDFIILTQPK